MNANKLRNFRTGAGLAGIVLLALTATAQDHSAHGHHDHGGVPEMGADGKRLESYQVKHQMDQATLAAFRKKIALYRGMTDMEINMNMSSMGPNYEWYASDRGKRGDVGVLILTHGVGENSDRILRESLTPISDRWPTAIGFGMAMMRSDYLQSSVDDLRARGARTIVLVPSGPTSSYNSLTRQWKYIFDLDNQESTYLDVPKVETDVKVMMTGHFEDHELITEILYDHAMEVSENPQNEALIIVAHGPEDIEDNIPDLEILQVHVDRIKARGEFADVKIINLQDDAIPAIRESNVRKLRRWVKQADSKGQTPVVVALASASHGVQVHIRQDLRGLDYVFADRGMAEHPNYVKWMAAVIEATIAEQRVAEAQ